MTELTHFLNNFTPFLVYVFSKIVLYSSFKGDCSTKGPCQKIKFSKKGYVANDISFP